MLLTLSWRLWFTAHLLSTHKQASLKVHVFNEWLFAFLKRRAVGCGRGFTAASVTSWGDALHVDEAAATARGAGWRVFGCRRKHVNDRFELLHFSFYLNDFLHSWRSFLNPGSQHSQRPRTLASFSLGLSDVDLYSEAQSHLLPCNISFSILRVFYFSTPQLKFVSLEKQSSTDRWRLKPCSCCSSRVRLHFSATRPADAQVSGAHFHCPSSRAMQSSVFHLDMLRRVLTWLQTKPSNALTAK